MVKAPARRLLVLALVLVAGCSGANREAGDRARRDVLTQEQVIQTGSSNAYDAVAMLRSIWLQPRGVDSFRTPGEVQVYFNDTRLGGVATLRSVSVNDVGQIQYFDGAQATGRWGLDHGHGVIYVTTLRPR
jgi:hypothetical protein